MNRADARAPTIVLATLLLCGVATAQMQPNVPLTRFAVEEKIEARLVNKSNTSISYCVEYGQSSPHDGTTESTPIPFFVESRHGGGWHVLLIGPDVGSMRHSEILDPGASATFPFRLNDKGEMRLSLYYWIGERSDVCDESAKGRKTTKSRVFSIVEK